MIWVAAGVIWLVTSFLHTLEQIDPSDTTTNFIVASIPTAAFILASLKATRPAGKIVLFLVALLVYGMGAGLHLDFTSALGGGTLTAALLVLWSGYISRRPKSAAAIPPGTFADQWLLEKPPRATIFPPDLHWGRSG